ncbi:MAG: SDR family oxidoreductase [Novosphingobium sp.]|nr:SDR family oxidoreductase [Novosphingobium sp.]
MPLAVWGGAECTINRVGDVYRDQVALSGHDERPDDLERFAALGISALRYPLLWESFASAPDPDALWAWHAERLERLRGLGVRPVLGLVHHGSGPRGTDLLSPGFIAGLAEHAAQAARRFPWVRDWTPVNEPLTTARFSALYGHWYPHRRADRAFWSALLIQIEATTAAMAAIRCTIPDARLIQTEDMGHTSATPERQGQADFDNERRWASWDMLAGRFQPGHALWDHIVRLGLGRRMEAVAAAPCVPDVLGLNHYLTSDRFLDHRLDRHPISSHGVCELGPVADVEAVRACDRHPGLDGAIRACWARYGLPIALTEVHNGCTREEQMRWLVEAWQTACMLRNEGVAVEAVTVWSLLGSHDWNSLLTRPDGHYESGVFDTRAKIPRETALVPLIRDLAAGREPAHPVLGKTGWWAKHAAMPRAQAAERPRPPGQPLLITGATGTLGQAFAGACRLRGIDHVLTCREQLDLTDPASIAHALDTMNPWAVINAAGWVRVDEAEHRPHDCIAANHVGALALSEACAVRGIHYTCFSSDLVFDGEAARPYVESDATAPLNVYGRSKAQTDEQLREIERTLVVRTASFFSPYDQHNFAYHLAQTLRAGEVFRAVSDCVTSPTYVPDLVRATLDLVIDDETGIWHLTSEGSTSWADFAVDLAEALDLPARKVEFVPLAEMGWAARRPRYAPLSSERGMIMPSLAASIQQFADTLA